MLVNDTRVSPGEKGFCADWIYYFVPRTHTVERVECTKELPGKYARPRVLDDDHCKRWANFGQSLQDKVQEIARYVGQ